MENNEILEQLKIVMGMQSIEDMEGFGEGDYDAEEDISSFLERNDFGAGDVDFDLDDYFDMDH